MDAVWGTPGSAPYDLIIMDVQMPVMDGIEATKMIREGDINSDITIIGLTARALKEDITECLDAGMNFYLTKPLDPVALITTIEHGNHEKQAESLPSLNQDVKPSRPALPIDYQIFNEAHANKTVSGDSHQTHPTCLLYTSPSPRDGLLSRMPSSA